MFMYVCIYIYIYIYICIYIYTFIHIHILFQTIHGNRYEKSTRMDMRIPPLTIKTYNGRRTPPLTILDFRGSESGRILNLRGLILMSIGAWLDGGRRRRWQRGDIATNITYYNIIS